MIDDIFSRSLFRCLLVGTLVCTLATAGHAQSTDQPQDSLREHILFMATFDSTTTAEIASGDGRLFTAKNQRSLGDAKPGLSDPNVALAKQKGLVGGALEFKKKDRLVTFYQAETNAGYASNRWSGAVSFWLKLDPATDLEPGFCDPIQITDSGYNDAAIWVDFTKDNPRDFRLGVIGDLVAWNPDKLPPDKNPGFERRLITVKQPTFSRDNWTHVLINFDALNSDHAKTELHLNGELKGELKVNDPFSWDEGNARILLGLNYIGLLDELVIFDRPLTHDEAERLYKTKGGIKSIVPLQR